MKKALLVILLLIIVGGIVFYFGWIQIQIPEHHYGVGFTKTRGYREEVFQPGKFYWSVEKLLPTNMTLHIFDCSPINRTVQIESTFPSAELYASVLDDRVSFSSQLTYTLSYGVNAEHLPRLVEEEGLLPEIFQEWMSVKEALISKAVLEFLQEAGPSALQTDITDELNRRFPDLIFHHCSVTSSSLADRDLYNTAKELYLGRLRSKQINEQEAENSVQAWIIPRKEKLAVMEEYGRILSEYPGLLKLLIDSGDGMAIELPGLDDLINNDR